VSASTRPLRLAHLAGQPAPSVLPLYRRLAAEPGVEFTVLYGSSEGLRPYDDGYGQAITWDADLLEGYDSVFLRAADRTPGLGTHFLAARNWDVVPILLREHYDALWMAGYYSATYVMAALAQRVAGGSVLFREEQTTLDSRSFRNMLAKQIALRPYLGMGWGLYISSENRRWLESHGLPADRLFAAPYTVDNSFFQAEAARLSDRRAELRGQFGIAPDSGPVIVTVSRLIEKKQPEFLIEAFRRARREHRGVLLIAGSGPLEADLRAQVERDAVPDVIFAGFLNRSRVAEAYAAADVFALLSKEKETFGLVVNEAMNFALPIVASDRVGSASDLVSRELNGFVIDAGDVDEAADAFKKLLSNPRLRARMGAASRKRIDTWGPEQSAQGILNALRASVQRPT
jgi:glycosyltransferase involved in cell wall biosynthesis